MEDSQQRVEEMVLAWEKLTLGPRDILVVTLAEQEAWRIARISRDIHEARKRFPWLKDVPIIVTRDGLALDQIDDVAGRRMLAELRRRFGDDATGPPEPASMDRARRGRGAP